MMNAVKQAVMWGVSVMGHLLHCQLETNIMTIIKMKQTDDKLLGGLT